MKKINIFIFGESGFIGSHLKNFLKAKSNIKIYHNKKKKFRNIKNIEAFYKKFWIKIINQSNTIVYLSFNNDLYDLNKDLSNSFSKTLLPLYILCETIKNHNKNIKVIYLSTASLYGNKKKLPVKENASLTLNNLYDYLKYSSEQILINSNTKNLNFQILRLSNVYGENLSSLNQSNRQILTKVIKTALTNKEIKVFGSGNYLRDFVHVKDVCEAIYKIICKKNLQNETFNIGSGKKMRLISIFKDIKHLINSNYNYSIKLKKIKLKSTNADKSNTRNFQASILKSKIKFDWKPKISFKVGLNNLIKFIYDKKYKN